MTKAKQANPFQVATRVDGAIGRTSQQNTDVTVREIVPGGALDAAMEAGAHILVMGRFGHSRLRDFNLGRATQGVFRNLRLTVLLTH